MSKWEVKKSHVDQGTDDQGGTCSSSTFPDEISEYVTSLGTKELAL